MIKKVVRIRCDECLKEFKRDDYVTVLTPRMEYKNGGVIEHVCRNCYNKDCLGLDHVERSAESMTKEWKEANGEG